MYTPKWSKHIFDEWENVMRRKNIGEAEITKRIQTAHEAFPDAFVENHESLIQGLNLSDKKDCHVLAAAIKTNANIIVTNNLKHFPEAYLASFGLAAKSADDFITDLVDLNPQEVVKAFLEMVLPTDSEPGNTLEKQSGNRYEKENPIAPDLKLYAHHIGHSLYTGSHKLFLAGLYWPDRL